MHFTPTLKQKKIASGLYSVLAYLSGNQCFSKLLHFTCISYFDSKTVVHKHRTSCHSEIVWEKEDNLWFVYINSKTCVDSKDRLDLALWYE